MDVAIALEVLVTKWRRQADVKTVDRTPYIEGWDAAKRQCADEIEAIRREVLRESILQSAGD